MTRRQRTQLDHLLTLHIVQRILTLILLAILLGTLYLIMTRLHAIAIAAPMLAVPVLKMVHPDMSAASDRTFVYPPAGPVVDRGGHGLHGYAYALGDRDYVSANLVLGMTWLVLVAPAVTPIRNWAKVQFTRAEVVGVYPDRLDDAIRHIARLTRNWTEPFAAAAMEQAHPDYRWAVSRVHRPPSRVETHVRSLAPAPLDAWNALMADINSMHAPPAPAPAAAPAIDDADAAHRAAQLALAERIQRQRKAARQRLREEHRAIPVDWFAGVSAPRGDHG